MNTYGLIAIVIVIIVVVIVITTSRRRANQPATLSATPAPGSVDRLNGIALAAIIVVFFVSLIGLILGYVARSEVRRSGERGGGLALAAIILGWTFIVISIFSVILVFALRPSYY